MMLWTCKKCHVIVVPDGITPADLAKAMMEHAKVCTKAGR